MHSMDIFCQSVLLFHWLLFSSTKTYYTNVGSSSSHRNSVCFQAHLYPFTTNAHPVKLIKHIMKIKCFSTRKIFIFYSENCNFSQNYICICEKSVFLTDDRQRKKSSPRSNPVVEKITTLYSTQFPSSNTKHPWPLVRKINRSNVLK